MTMSARSKLREKILLGLLAAVTLACLVGYGDKVYTEKHIAIDASKFQAIGEALERANVAYWEWNPRTQEMRWSTFLWRVYDTTPNSVETIDLWQSMIVEEDRYRARKTLQDAANSRSPYVMSYKVKGESGEIHNILETAAWDPGRNVLLGLCVRTSESDLAILHRLPNHPVLQ